MTFNWDRDWWMVILFAVFAVPFVQAIFAPWNRYLRYRERREAMETLKVYATQGREPLPDVLSALSGRPRWREAAEAAVDRASARADAATSRVDEKMARRQDRWLYRHEYRARLQPMRQWNWAIFATAITVGFAFAWKYAHHDNDTFLIVAIIAGALAVAGVITALLTTFWRVD